MSVSAFFLLMMFEMPHHWEGLMVLLMGAVLIRSFRNSRLLALQFQNGDCFLYFKSHVLHVVVSKILPFRLGWLLVTHQGRYFIFHDALSREDMHELIWQLNQVTDR